MFKTKFFFKFSTKLNNKAIRFLKKRLMLTKYYFI